MGRSFYAKVNDKVAKISGRIFARLTDCGFVKVRTKEERAFRRFRLFGKTLFSLGRKTASYDLSKPTFYLKVNRIAPYTILCIQKWLDILSGGGCKLLHSM